MGTVTTIHGRGNPTRATAHLAALYTTADLAVMHLQQVLIDGGHGGDDLARLTRIASAALLRRWERRGTVAHYLCAEPVAASSLAALAAEVRDAADETEGVLWQAVFAAQGVA